MYGVGEVRVFVHSLEPSVVATWQCEFYSNE